MKRCFIVTPIGEKDSDTRKKANAIICFIRPIIESLKYKVFLPDTNVPGSIMEYIVGHLYNDELVVANLTGLNPNVMYEIGVRHAFGKPTVCIFEKGQQFPFDIKDFRTIIYENNLSAIESFRNDLIEMISSAHESMSNPVSLALSRIKENKQLPLNNQKVQPIITLPLILELYSDSGEKPNRNDVYAIIKKVYSEYGYKPSMTLYDSVTGRIEIKDGYHKEVLSPLIAKMVNDLHLNSVRILDSQKGRL